MGQSAVDPNVVIVCGRCRKTEIVAPWSHLLLYGWCARCYEQVTFE